MVWIRIISLFSKIQLSCSSCSRNVNVGTAFEPGSSGIQTQHWINRAKGLTHKPDLVGMPYTVNRFNSNPLFTISYNIFIAIDFFSPCKRNWLIKYMYMLLNVLKTFCKYSWWVFRWQMVNRKYSKIKPIKNILIYLFYKRQNTSARNIFVVSNRNQL